MTSDRIFAALSAHMETQVTAAGGRYDASETVEQTLALLGNAPGSWRVILQWMEDKPTGERGEMQVTVLLIVQSARGLDVRPGADAMPLLRRFNQAASWLRAVWFDNSDIERAPWRQGNTGWLVSPDFPTRQIKGEFSIKYGLNEVELVRLTVE